MAKGEMINENGKWRELVHMRVEPHDGNEAGTVRIYRDQLPEGAVVVEDEVSNAAADDDEVVVRTPAAATKKRRAG